MAELEARRLELESLLADAPAPSSVLIHPKMGDRYRQEVARLREALNEESRRVEAAEIVRGLIETITLTPVGEHGRTSWSIDLTGHLAGILSLAGAKTRKGGTGAASQTADVNQQVKLVAGAGFEPTTFRL